MFQAKLIYTEELKINRMINCVLKYQKRWGKYLDPYLGTMWNCTDCAKKDEEKGQVGASHRNTY